MTYEVEQKFPVDDLDLIVQRIERLDGVVGPPVTHHDRYFSHPARDFEQTDEALRIRTIDREARITYKGPKIDSETKTRREIELRLGEDRDGEFSELLAALGFTALSDVYKQRRTTQVEWEGTEVEVSFDRVEQLGTYVELEIMADDGSLDRARQTLRELAAHLELHNPERRGYIQLLLAKRGDAR